MSLGEELRQVLGSDAIADDPETLAAHSGDKWFATEAPEVVETAQICIAEKNCSDGARRRLRLRRRLRAGQEGNCAFADANESDQGN